MPDFYVSEPYVNVWIFDTPLSYPCALGSEMAVQLMWRQRGEAMSYFWSPDKFSALGNRWGFPWRAALPQPIFDETGYGKANLFLPSGAALYLEFFNWSNLSEHNYFNNTKLERVVNSQTNETGYIVHYPNGSQDVYGFAATNDIGYLVRYCLSSASIRKGMRPGSNTMPSPKPRSLTDSFRFPKEYQG